MTDDSFPDGAPSTDQDDLDRRLVAALRKEPRAGLATLGEAIGLSADAARKRLRRLESAGEIRVVGAVDPSIFGLKSFALVGVQVTGRTSTVLDHLQGVDAIDYVLSTAGPFDLLVEVIAHTDAELNELVDRHIRAAPGVLRSEIFLYLDVVKWSVRPMGLLSPDQERTSAETFDNVDLKLLAVLQRNGRASYQELASSTGITYSTARRRVQQLLNSDVIDIVTEVNDIGSGERAMAAVGLRFEGDPRVGLSKIAESPDVPVAVLTNGRFDAFIELEADDRQRLSERLREIASNRGVQRVTSFPYLNVPLLPYAWALAKGGSQG